ncbi:hypothetical protein AURDEDRAFT_181614 [Auricularia subglabra TFB-10046 SS5]|nr:hypothetical protein AURDEDRAFT_181614 [Auricularia subglabra TFB-10046 SS5]
MSDGQGSCLAICCGGCCSTIIATLQQMCFFTTCGRGQDGPQRGGCCDSCLAKSFDEDDFEAQQRQHNEEVAAARSADALPPATAPMTASAMGAVPAVSPLVASAAHQTT